MLISSIAPLIEALEGPPISSPSPYKYAMNLIHGLNTCVYNS